MASTGTTTRATPLSDADPLGEVMLRSPKSPTEAINACDALSRAGKLPGFKRTSPTSGEARVFGQPFDRDVLVSAIDAPSGSVVRLSTRPRRKIPVLFAIVGVATVWPGVWLTDSLIMTYFSGASNWVVKTWMWYLPLAIIPLPFAARSMWRKSRESASAHFAELQQRIASTVGASMDASASPAREGPSRSREPESVSASA